MPLTDAAIKNAKPQGKPYKMYDTGGLFMIVTPAGGKWWRLKYRFGGKEKLLSLGVSPEVGLKEARRRRDEAKKQVSDGIDPGVHRKAVKAAVQAEEDNTFEIIAREWFARQKNTWVKSHSDKLISRLENHIFLPLGTKPIHMVTAPELLHALRRIEARGAVESAHRILQDCGRIFRYAIATGRAERDPAADLRGALTPYKSVSFPTITDVKTIGALLRDIDAYTGHVVVRAALQLSPYVFVRPGELRRAEWSEFNFDAAEWRIPAARMKMKETHFVPLARQVVTSLKDLHAYTGQGRYVFPSLRAPSTPISDVALLAALRRMGYDKDTMTVHGFRSMASTLLNEQGYNRDWIERQLAHGERNAVRAAYNYAEYLPERRRMMQEWADYLDGLRETKD